MYKGVSNPIGYGNRVSGIHLIRAGIMKETNRATLSKPTEPREMLVEILKGILNRDITFT